MTTNTATLPMTGRKWFLTVSLTASTNKVKPGISTPMPSNTSLNRGTTNSSNKARMPMATINTATG